MYYICGGFSVPLNIENDLMGFRNETAFVISDFATLVNDIEGLILKITIFR